MKLRIPSTGSPLITSLALALAVVVAVWCIKLASDASELRRRLADDIRDMVSLEDLRTRIVKLDDLASQLDTEGDKAISMTDWRSQYEFAVTRLDGFGRSLAENILELRSLLTRMDELVTPVLLGDEPSLDLVEFRELWHTAGWRREVAVGKVDQHQTDLVARLGRIWQSLYALSVAAIGTTMLLMSLFQRAKRDAAKHRAAEEALRKSEERLVESNTALERRVATRTTELRTANETLENRNVELKAEVAERQRTQEVQQAHNHVLERLGAGASLDEVLSLLVEIAEEVHPEMLCSVLLLDDDRRLLRFRAAVSLPGFFNEAIKTIVVHAKGPFSTATDGRRHVVEDLERDVAWEPFLDITHRAGIGACWTEPIHSSTNVVLGVFAIFFRQTGRPTATQLEFMISLAHLAGIAVDRTRAKRALRRSRERLRVADRLASLGTLTAGLGHDMNNILLPMRCRFDTLDIDDVPDDYRELLVATRETVEYLQQISDGLRLLAVDPEHDEASGEVTVVSEWWPRVRPLLSKMVREEITLEASWPAQVPSLKIAPHRLTQAVMNLIVNASEASPGGGTIRVWADADGVGGSGSKMVRICVSDEGVGMSDDVRRRVFDPFFTTKKRSFSTGLGLSLVLNVVTLSGGTVDIDSKPGVGTTVTLSLPIAKGGSLEDSPVRRGRALVTLSDPRRAAWVSNLLTLAGYEVMADGPAFNGKVAGSGGRVWVTEPSSSNLSRASRFIDSDPSRHVIVLGQGDAGWNRLGAVVVEDVEKLDAIRDAVDSVVMISRGDHE